MILIVTTDQRCFPIKYLAELKLQTDHEFEVCYVRHRSAVAASRLQARLQDKPYSLIICVGFAVSTDVNVKVGSIFVADRLVPYREAMTGFFGGEISPSIQPSIGLLEGLYKQGIGDYLLISGALGYADEWITRASLKEKPDLFGYGRVKATDFISGPVAIVALANKILFVDFKYIVHTVAFPAKYDREEMVSVAPAMLEVVRTVANIYNNE